MEELENKIVETVMENLYASLGGAVILDAENPLDAETPTGVPLQIVGVGIAANGNDYPGVPGFDQIRKSYDDPYYILKGSARTYVVRQSIDHEVMFCKSAVKRAVESASYDIIESVEHHENW